MNSDNHSGVSKIHDIREDLPTWSPKVTVGGLLFLIISWTLFGWLGLLVLSMFTAITFVSTKIILTKYGIFPNLFPAGHFKMLSSSDLASTCTNIPQRNSVFKSTTLMNGSTGYKICLICGDISCDRHPESHSISLTPWKSLLVQEDVNDELESLVNKLVEYFVNSWYKELLKHKEADLMQSKSFDETSNRFICEVKEIVRFLVSSVVLQLNRMSDEVPNFILHNLVKSLVNHMTLFIQGKRSAKSARFIEEAVLRYYRENYCLHPAVRSSSCQVEYLRHLSDSLLPFVVPPKYLSSPPVRSLLREILFGVILSPIVEVTCQPECINQLFVALCSSNLVGNDEPIKHPGSYVELLRDLSITGSVKSASLSSSPQRTLGSRWPLGIALKSILSDQQMLFLFMQFLKQEGAVNFIQFYLAAQDLTDKLCNPDLTQDRLVYLNREAQSVYHSFIHPEAVDLIIFTNHKQLQNDFAAILDSGKVQDVEKLRTCGSLLDAIYEVSLQLEQTYCGLFFATSSYMKLVAGSSVSSTSSLPLSQALGDEASSKSPKLKSHRRQTSMSSLKKAMKESFWPAIDDGIIPASSSYHDLSSYRSASLSEVDKIALPRCKDSEKVSATSDTSSSINTGTRVLSTTETNDAHRCKSFTSLNDSRELKDMKNWQVSVSTVETRLDHNLKYFNVYIVKVKDPSNSESSQPIINRSVEDGSLDAAQWIVERRDHEFYALESKLKEFHGDSLASFNEYKPLSVNRNWQTLIAGTSNQKQSLDSKRIEFQSYLSNLIKCDKLKGSQLVYNFLSKADEFTADSLSLRKMIRSVPGKWTLEKGQNLDHFISRLLSKALESPYSFSISQNSSPSHSSRCQSNEHHPSAPGDADENDVVDVAHETDETNSHAQRDPRVKKDTSIAFDYLLWILHYFISLDEKHFIVRALVYLEVVIRSSFESIVDLVVYIFLRNSISSLPSVLRLLRYLNISIEEKMNDVSSSNSSKDSRDLHKQASDSLVCWLKGIPFASSLQQPAYLFFTMTQYPMLNRQLIFTWIDDLIGFYFPQITQRNGDAR